MNKKYLLPLLLLVQIILVKVLSCFPHFVEKYYSNGLYIYISKFLRIIFGWIPFSIGDIGYSIIIFVIIKWIKKNRIGFFKNYKTHGLSIVSFLSVLYFAFHLLWGLNYYRLSMAEKLQVKTEYSFAELENITQQLIIKTNAIQFEITQDSDKKVVLPFDHSALYEKSLKGYELIPKPLCFVSYQYKSIKSSVFSFPLSFMGFGGYLNPFTNEAQVNHLKPIVNAPATTCHEMAHQTGLASESECNFIGFITAKANKNKYFQYSAYQFALAYCLSNLESQKTGSSKNYLKKINKGVLENFEENKMFWENYQSWINKFFKVFYHNFLKLNQQKDGLEGYSNFIGLLINYNLKHHEI